MREASAKQINVVGAVIDHDGLILCAQRGPDGALPGRWEFPGGKIEDGETAREALLREVREELLCEITVGSEITTTTHAYDFGVVTLTTFYCTLISGVPELTEHAEVRWLTRDVLPTLDWSPADVPTVELVAESVA